MPEETFSTNLEYTPPKWLEDTLAAIAVSPQLRERCRVSALAAYSIDQMRTKEGRRPVFSPLPFGKYVKALADLAKVDINPVLETYRLSSLSTLDWKALPVLSRLARQLEISRSHLRDLIRISFAETLDFDASVLMAAFNGAPPLTPLEAAEAQLDVVEASYRDSDKQRLAAILSLIESGYGAE
jgi:hypothetical protein